MTVIPDAIDPYVGLRVWSTRKTDDGWRLASVVYDVEWPARDELVAECSPGRRVVMSHTTKRTPHTTPDKQCTCGVYAAATPVPLQAYAVPTPHPWARMWTGVCTPSAVRLPPESSAP